MAKTISIQPEELHARAYADRLILRELTDMESAMKLGELAERLSGQVMGFGRLGSGQYCASEGAFGPRMNSK